MCTMHRITQEEEDVEGQLEDAEGGPVDTSILSEYRECMVRCRVPFMRTAPEPDALRDADSDSDAVPWDMPRPPVAPLCDTDQESLRGEIAELKARESSLVQQWAGLQRALTTHRHRVALGVHPLQRAAQLRAGMLCLPHLTPLGSGRT